MTVSLKQLQHIMPHAGLRVLEHFLPHINNAMKEFGIKSQHGMSHFLAQLSHETGSLHRLSENLNYSKAERLMAVWPKRFPNVVAALPYVSQPEKLANFVYAGRMGNGTPESGDGWRYRGAGGFQLTGKNNHMLCADFFKVTPAKIGDWLRSPEGSMRSAAWFFSTSGALTQAELGRVDKVSDIINLGRMTDKVGDSVGYAERTYLTRAALNSWEHAA